MPAIIPLIPLIVGGIGAASSIGGLFGGGDKAKAPAAEAAKPPDQTQEKEQILAAAPSVQERLGGAVAPDFFANEVARVTGNPGDTDLAKSVLSQFLGLGDTSSKMGLNDGGTTGEAGGQNFSPFNVSGSSTHGAQPSFFEGLLGGGGSGGDGMNEFSGGFQ